MAVVVVSPQIEDNTCTEVWADPEEVAAAVNVTSAEALEATIEATWIMWALTGYKFHGWQCWQEDYILSPGQNKIAPPRGPVSAIISVSSLAGTSVSGDTAPVDGWTWDGRYISLGNCNSGSPYLTDLYPCGPCDSEQRYRVEYRLRPYLPPGASRAVLRMGSEFYKARTGQKCSLPERITSVTRQGVSWTILDPQDFLTFGRTGIGPVDGWIAAVSRMGVIRVTDPLFAPVVLNSVQTGCEQSCGETP